ncbi:DegQ family serine endoprotease, partial [Candidatus Sumerlaeota bacterium]|nr:DegQ family serine endoprotease [Candidatus Sumerlaeota bacterium]
MRRWHVAIMFLIVLLTLPVYQSFGLGNPEPQELAASGKKYLRALSDAFVEATEKVKPAVVSIVSIKKVRFAAPQWSIPEDFFDPFKDFWGDDFLDRFFRHRFPQREPREYTQRGLGSGVIVDGKNGYILTANHVVEGADEINVMLSDKRTFKAKIIGTDPKTDVAVLQIKGKNLPEAELGDSDKLRVGDWVVAIGNPFELYYTVTAGIVSAKGRSIGITGRSPEDRGYEDFIQTDAAINPGNSGGPLIDLEGKVVGINDAIATRSGGYMGIGFAIPINMAKSVMEQLITYGEVIRGWLGVGIQNLTPELAKEFKIRDNKGVLVTQVFSDSPAEEAGFQPGDVIVEVDGDKIEDIDELRNMIAFMRPGTEVEIVVIRDGHRKTLDVTIGKQPAEISEAIGGGAELTHSKFGITVAELNNELRRKYGIPKGAEGVVVTGVKRGSTAQLAGIKEGDLIVEVNRKKVTSLDEYS